MLDCVVDPVGQCQPDHIKDGCKRGASEAMGRGGRREMKGEGVVDGFPEREAGNIVCKIVLSCTSKEAGKLDCLV